jgi:hypothetical protein
MPIKGRFYLLLCVPLFRFNAPVPRSFEKKLFDQTGQQVFYGGQSFTSERYTFLWPEVHYIVKVIAVPTTLSKIHHFLRFSSIF